MRRLIIIGKLIRKIYMYCPVCDNTHEIEERECLTTVPIKGDLIAYAEKYYYCSKADKNENEFETGSMTNENLLNARNAYRKKHGLLTSDEMIAIRKSNGISREELAKILDTDTNTVFQYETKAIQDDTYDLKLRMIGKRSILQSLKTSR